MKKIIVTGCNGQLGRAVNLFFKDNKDISFVNTDVGELDITDIDKVMELAREVQPMPLSIVRHIPEWMPVRQSMTRLSKSTP